MIGLVGIIKENLRFQGKLPDKWKEESGLILTIPKSHVDEEGKLVAPSLVVTENGILEL